MDVENEVNELDFWQKQSFYGHYLAIQLVLKHTVPWPDIYIKTFDEFISNSNIEVRDLGVNWKEHGYAQQIWVQYYGIYEWYWKFKNEIYKGKLWQKPT